jgi:hypothetical protein
MEMAAQGGTDGAPLFNPYRPPRIGPEVGRVRSEPIIAPRVGWRLHADSGHRLIVPRRLKTDGGHGVISLSLQPESLSSSNHLSRSR